MFWIMYVIFIKINAFILNGQGWDSCGPIIKERLGRKKEYMFRHWPLVFTNHDSRKVGWILIEKKRN